MPTATAQHVGLGGRHECAQHTHGVGSLGNPITPRQLPHQSLSGANMLDGTRNAATIGSRPFENFQRTI
jgi:hypothetical protein